MIKTFYFNPFRVCTYIVSDDNHNAVIIDAGMQTAREKERVAEYIAKNNLTLRAHLLTHGHLDHLMGARFIYEKYGLLPHLMPADEWYFSRQDHQAAAFGCEIEDEPLQEFIPLKDEQILTFGDLQFRVIATPGHTRGGCCYYADGVLFSGDTLFAGGIGRTDLPGGDYATIIQSIQKRILSLPENTLVYPGHGFDTTLKIEKTENPYL